MEPTWEATGLALTETCHEMYHRTATHLGPEISRFFTWRPSPLDLTPEEGSAHYLLRPEAAESIFYAFYYTGDPKYREWAYAMLQSLNKYAKVQCAAARRRGRIWTSSRSRFECLRPS